MPGRIENELEKWFPREPQTTEIWLDFSTSEQRLEQLQKKLYATQQWKDFSHLPHEVRTVRMSLSDLTEKAIPFIETLLEDSEIERSDKTPVNTNNKPAIVGIALHEALSLFDLWRSGTVTDDAIDKTFPTQSMELIVPFIEAIKEKGDMGIREVWRKLHTDARLVDRTQYLLSQEFDRLPFSIEKQEELKVRSSEEVYNAGVKLSENLGGDLEENIEHCSEALCIFNFVRLSLYGDSRIQIPVRFDEIMWEKINKRFVRHHFFDLKTGRNKNTWSQQFQYCLMEFLAGHFIDQFMVGGEVPNTSKCLVSKPIKTITPSEHEYTFEYGFFDKTSGNISRLPVSINYNNRQGELFLAWLAFYSDACCAFKDILKQHIKNDVPIDRSILAYRQPDLVSTLNHGEAYTSFEYPSSHYAINVESIAEENCPVCAMKLTQFCTVKRDIGGDLVDIIVQQYCQGHHFTSDPMRVAKDTLVFVNK